MAITVEQYSALARRFLRHRFPDGKIRLKELCAKDVIGFILQETTTRGRRASQFSATAMRSFLRYLFQEGRTATDLAMAIPPMPGGRLSELPRYLEAEQVEKLLQYCDRRRKVGKRDHAILLLLARLGLRAGEVTRLAIEDIDWASGELLIRGKGDRIDRMPLLQRERWGYRKGADVTRALCIAKRRMQASAARQSGLWGRSSGIGACRVEPAKRRAFASPFVSHEPAPGWSFPGRNRPGAQAQTNSDHRDLREGRSERIALTQPWPGGAQ